MPKLLFEKGNKLGKGGKREGAGDKPKAVKLAMEQYKLALEKAITDNQAKLAKAYALFAETDAATARDLAAKVLPAAKQEIELSGKLKVVKVDAFDPE